MTVADVTTAGQLRMSLADVARLAHVERSVASMWRTRINRVGIAFPPPVGEQGGHDVFDAHAVADWLGATGLGNNPDASADVVAHAQPTAELAGLATYDRVGALLTIAAVSHEQLRGLTVDELLDLAEDIDPDDDFLLSEVEHITPEAPPLLAYVDHLADAAFSAERALELVTEQHRRRSGGPARRQILRPEAITLVSRVATAVTEALELPSPSFVDPTHGGCDLLLATALTAFGAAPVTVMTGERPGVEPRRARRRLRAHGLVHETCEVVDGTVLMDRHAVIVAQWPDPERAAMSSSEILHEVDELSLQMGADQAALILAPAGALSDRLRSGDDEAMRDSIMRDGRLRMVLRLPAGMSTHLGQQQLTLWLLGPAQPGVAVAERRTIVGDLTGTALTEDVIDEVATDAVVALASAELAATHHLSHASVVPTAQVMRWRGNLMAHVTGEQPFSEGDSARAVLGIHRRSEALGVAGEWLAEPGSISMAHRARRITIEHAQRHGAARVLPGHRLRGLCAVPIDDAGVPVIGPDDLEPGRPWRTRRFHRLALESAFPESRLTRPGDVVFATNPRVIARVDHEGGAVVAAPARVLRVSHSAELRGALSPDVLAADLNAQPRAGRNYRAWQVRVIGLDQVEPLETAAQILDARETELAAQLAELSALRAQLIDGVAENSVRLTSAADTPNSHSSLQDSPQKAGR